VGAPRRSWAAGQVGHPDRKTGGRRRGGGQISPQYAETGGPFTRGRGGQAYGAGTGNIARTRRAGATMSTCVPGIATKAQAHPKHRFGHLDELLHEPFFNECWRDLRTEAA